MRGTWWALAVGALVTAYAPVARAFDPDGHQILEAIAYRQMMDDPGYPARGRPPGVERLRRLIQDGVLAPPPCWDDEDDCGEEERAKSPLLWWPAPHTAQPDKIIARQFSSAGQCFHFMAERVDEERASDGRTKVEERIGRISGGLSEAAPRRCLGLMDEIVRRIVADPVGARQRRYGVYELLHAIADSYSRAHTERRYDEWQPTSDVDPRIAYLKVWQPTASAWWRNETLPTRHEVFEERDANYIERFKVVDGRACTTRTDRPYFPPPSCLTTEGALAARAMRDALEVIDDLRRAHAGKTLGEVDFGPWEEFKRRHFSLVATEERRGAYQLTKERNPWLALGLLHRIDFQSALTKRPFAMDQALEVRGFLTSPLLDPVLLFSSVAPGMRTTTRETHFLLSTDVGIALPMFEHFFVSVVPIGLEAGVQSEQRVFDARARVRLDWLPRNTHFMLSIMSPEYSWPTGNGHLSAGLVAAYHLDYDATGRLSHPTDRVKPPDPAAPHWDPPPTPDVELRSGRASRTVEASVGVAGGRPAEGRQDTVGKLREGFDLVFRKRNAWGEPQRFSFGFGVEGRAEFMRGSENTYVTFDAHALGRMQLVGPVGLALVSGFDSGNWGRDRRPGALTRLGLSFTFGRVAAVLESPGWSITADGSRLLPEELAGARIILDFFDISRGGPAKNEPRIERTAN